MSSEPLIDLVRARAALLRGLWGAVSGAVPHDALRGRFREVFLEALVQPFLPPHVRAVAGTIAFPDGSARVARNEEDIILFDTNRAPLLLGTSGREAIVPNVGVLCTIEVKSNLSVEDLRRAVAAAAELAMRTPDTMSAPIGKVFALTSEIARDANLGRMVMSFAQEAGWNPGPRMASSPLQSVCVADRGAWQLTDFRGLYPALRPGWYRVAADRDNAVVAFTAVLSNTLYGQASGIGAYITDDSWFTGPDPETPVLGGVSGVLTTD